jgi:hypothetical protein
MKFIFSLILLSCINLAHAAQNLGVGAMIGHPVGFTAKQWVKSTEAIDVGAAWSIGPNPHFLIFSDYLWHKTDALYFKDTEPLDFYFGIGGRMKFADEIELGVRLPIGLAAYYQDRQIETFLEVAPIVDFISKTDVEGHLVVGLRIYF